MSATPVLLIFSMAVARYPKDTSSAATLITLVCSQTNRQTHRHYIGLLLQPLQVHRMELMTGSHSELMRKPPLGEKESHPWAVQREKESRREAKRKKRRRRRERGGNFMLEIIP